MDNVFLRCKCEKCGEEFITRELSKKQYKIGDRLPHINCGAAKVVGAEEMGNPKNCKGIDSLNPSEKLYKMQGMTDEEIGKVVRGIAGRGNTAEVKRNKDGIVILEVGKKIVRKDNVSSGRELLEP